MKKYQILSVVFALMIALSACSLNGGDKKESALAEISQEDAMKEALFGSPQDSDYYANSDAPFDLFGGQAAREQVASLYKVLQPVDVLFFGGTEGSDTGYLLGRTSLVGIVCGNGISVPDPLTPMRGSVNPYAFLTPEMIISGIDRENAGRKAAGGNIPLLKPEDLVKFAYRLAIAPEGIEIDTAKPLRVDEVHNYITFAVPEELPTELATEQCAFPRGDVSLLKNLNFVHVFTGKSVMDGRIMTPPEDASKGGFLVSVEREPSAPLASGGNPVIAYNRATGMPQVVGVILWETQKKSGIYIALDIAVALGGSTP